MADSGKPIAAPFREIIDVQSLPATGLEKQLKASPEARKAIAQRLRIPSVDDLQGKFLVRSRGAEIVISGTMDARIVQLCVASLEPVEETIQEAFELRFSQDVETSAAAAEIDVADDAPEPLESNDLDLAEILVQQLSLAMDPYPRKPGAPPLTAKFGSSGPISPFESLRGAIAGDGDEE